MVGGLVTAPRKPATKSAKSVEIGTNLGAIEEMIAVLRASGRLERVDAARVEIARTLARAVDEHPDNVGLWQQYRAAEQTLREVTDDSNDDLADLFRSFDSAVRDATKPGKGNAWR